jgi:hypothetical protein
MKTIYTETDPTTGLRREVQTDGRHMREVTRSDPAATRATLDRMSRLRADDGYARTGIKEGWHHAASVPAEVWLRWANEGFDIFKAHPTEILKRLRDRDYERLRATSGRI